MDRANFVLAFVDDAIEQNEMFFQMAYGLDPLFRVQSHHMGITVTVHLIDRFAKRGPKPRTIKCTVTVIPKKTTGSCTVFTGFKNSVSHSS